MNLTTAIGRRAQSPARQNRSDMVRRYGAWFRSTHPADRIARSWIFQYKIGRETRRLVIGQRRRSRSARAREIAGQHHASGQTRPRPCCREAHAGRTRIAHVRRLGGKVLGPATGRTSTRKLPGGQAASWNSQQATTRPARRHGRPAHHRRPDWPRSRRTPAR